MIDEFGRLLDLVVTQRYWSWTIVAILYLLIGTTIRSWFLGTSIAKAKALEDEHWRNFKKAYLRRAWMGWIYFLIPMGIAADLWQNAGGTRDAHAVAYLLLAGCISFLLSIVSHLQAMTLAGIYALKQATQNSPEPF